MEMQGEINNSSGGVEFRATGKKRWKITTKREKKTEGQDLETGGRETEKRQNDG